MCLIQNPAEFLRVFGDGKAHGRHAFNGSAAARAVDFLVGVINELADYFGDGGALFACQFFEARATLGVESDF